jgi:hypothetical protein
VVLIKEFVAPLAALFRIAASLSNTVTSSFARHDSPILPELVARAHDTVKIWAKELLIRLDEYLAEIIGRHIPTRRSRGIRVRPFTKAELQTLHKSL